MTTKKHSKDATEDASDSDDELIVQSLEEFEKLLKERVHVEAVELSATQKKNLDTKCSTPKKREIESTRIMNSCKRIKKECYRCATDTASTLTDAFCTVAKLEAQSEYLTGSDSSDERKKKRSRPVAKKKISESKSTPPKKKKAQRDDK